MKKPNKSRTDVETLPVASEITRKKPLSVRTGLKLGAGPIASGASLGMD